MTDQLLRLGTIWSEVSERSLATLGSKVANESGLFARLADGKDCNTGTIEKFLSFFRDGANWPAGRVPQDACDLLDNFENIAVEASASTGKSGDLTAAAERAA